MPRSQLCAFVPVSRLYNSASRLSGRSAGRPGGHRCGGGAHAYPITRNADDPFQSREVNYHYILVDVAGLTVEDVHKPATGTYLDGIEQAVVHYGTSTGFFNTKMLANGPEYLSAAVLYESNVIESYSSQYSLPFPVVAIYPKEGTFWSDHPIGIIERDWVTPEHREAAKAYTQFLLERPQQEKTLGYGFHPGDVTIQPSAPLDADHGVDPKEPKTTLEVPSVEVMDAIIQLWREHKKHANIVLVFDTSGSMKEDNKMPGAKNGAKQLTRLAFIRNMDCRLNLDRPPNLRRVRS